MDDGRRRHYGTFYGLEPLPEPGPQVLVAYGNCQAEAMRVAVTSTPTPDVVGIRIPPVHEMVRDDLPHLERVLGRADILLCQPITDGYRDLPLGDAEISRWLRPEARVLRFPVIFYRGLFPFQVVVHSRGVVDPPLVPYQDLRWIAEAAGLPQPRLTPGAIHEMAQQSIEELRRREAALGLIPVSEAVVAAGAEAMHTVNHPGNPVLLHLATEVRRRLGLSEQALDPGRVLLRSIFTPRLPEVLDALALQVPPTTTWQVEGREVTDQEVREVHLEWLRAHPVAVQATLERHGDLLRRLGSQT